MKKFYIESEYQFSNSFLKFYPKVGASLLFFPCHRKHELPWWGGGEWDLPCPPPILTFLWSAILTYFKFPDKCGSSVILVKVLNLLCIHVFIISRYVFMLSMVSLISIIYPSIVVL